MLLHRSLRTNLFHGNKNSYLISHFYIFDMKALYLMQILKMLLDNTCVYDAFIVQDMTSSLHKICTFFAEDMAQSF